MALSYKERKYTVYAQTCLQLPHALHKNFSIPDPPAQSLIPRLSQEGIKQFWWLCFIKLPAKLATPLSFFSWTHCDSALPGGPVRLLTTWSYLRHFCLSPYYVTLLVFIAICHSSGFPVSSFCSPVNKPLSWSLMMGGPFAWEMLWLNHLGARFSLPNWSLYLHLQQWLLPELVGRSDSRCWFPQTRTDRSWEKKEHTQMFIK